MATTTTIYPTDDTHIREPNASTNYGTGIYLPIGEWSGGRRHALLEFDVSSFTEPSDIVSANFSLTAISSSGGSTRNMTLARLDQSFVDTSATWNTYNGVDSWVTAGAEDNAATTQPTYTIEVGATTNQTVDIKPLVIDAINKRAGVLLLVIFFSAGASAYTTFGSTDNLSTPNKPSLAVTVAARISWTGAIDNDLDNDDNWSPLLSGKPTSTDYALFSSGSVSATDGGLECDTIFIGKGYTGSIENSRRVDCNQANIFSPESDISLNFIAAGQAQVRVGDCKSLALNGNYDLTISRCRSSVTLRTASVDRIDAHSSRVAFVADANVDLIRITDAKYTLDNGADSITATGRSYGYISATTNTTAAITVSGGYIKMLAKEVDSLTIYSGRLDFRKNIQAPLDMGAVKIYSGVLDSRTDSATFAAQSIVVYGGRLLLDGSQQTTLA